MTCKVCLRRIAAIERLAAVSPRSPIGRAFSTIPHNIAGPSTPSRTTIRFEPSRWQRFYTNQAHSSSLSRGKPSSSIPFRRTAATLARSVEPSHQTPQTPIKVIPPSIDAIKEEGYLDDDVALIPPEEAWLNITPAAVSHLEKITSKEPAEVLAQNKLALRVGVESGGCHGFQYTMELVEERGVDDYIMQPEGVKCIPVVVDLTSLGLLKGATLHHATELIGSSFRLQDNPQAKEGGNCGCGVSWELK